jgi:hypothetical protein
MTKAGPIHWEGVRTARVNLRRLARRHPELTAPPSEENRRGWEQELGSVMAEETNDEQLVVRLPKALLERLDAYAERLRHEMPGPSWKRSDVVRLLQARALDNAEPRKAKRRNA